MGYIKRSERAAPPHPIGRYIEFLGHVGRDPFAALDEFGNPPPFWVDDPVDVDGYWVVTGYEDVRVILQDAETFSSTDAQIPHFEKADPLLPTESDPPYTQKLRMGVMPHLTANRVQALTRRMYEVSTQLIEAFRENGRCDVVKQFAQIYPITVFLEFFGLDVSRREEFRHQAHLFLNFADERLSAWTKIRAIVEEHLVAKRKEPADDVLSAIAQCRLDGEYLDTPVAVSLASSVFLGGLDTVASNLAWDLRFLATHPDHRRQIVEHPELLPNAIEEFLRLYSVANPIRRVTKDIEFSGANMCAGDRVQLSISAANRDRRVFGAGVDFTRVGSPHLAFATGAHRCLGSHLARLEITIALETWHKLLPDYRMSADAALQYHGPIFAMESLPLEWDV
jgi:cytochrome P450